MIGLMFLGLWPLMGIAAFLLAIIWYLKNRPEVINIKKMLIVWTIVAMTLSATCAIADGSQLFIIPGLQFPDVILYGPLMIFPVPVGAVLGLIVGFWLRRVSTIVRRTPRK